MITAERTVLLLPGALLVIDVVLRCGAGGWRLEEYFLSVFWRLHININYFFLRWVFVDSEPARDVFFMRLLVIPGLFVSQYYDLFSTRGYACWAHVTGIGSLVDIPAAYAADPKWPELGKILAERVLDVQSQSNASFVATDGVAAAGRLVCLPSALQMRFGY